MLDAMGNATKEDFATVTQAGIGRKLGKLGEQPPLVTIEEGIDLTRRKAFGTVIFKARPPGSMRSVMRVARSCCLIVSGMSRPATSSVRISGGAGFRAFDLVFRSENMRVFYTIRRQI